jgi:hypothetical protein
VTPRQIADFLKDMIDAIDLTQEFTSGLTFKVEQANYWGYGVEQRFANLRPAVPLNSQNLISLLGLLNPCRRFPCDRSQLHAGSTSADILDRLSPKFSPFQSL